MPEQRMDPVETINALAAQGRIELPTPPRPPSLMDVIATAGVDKLPMLWELYERQQKMDAEKAFNQAMALVQERMQPVLREANNPATHSKYARLEHIDKAIRPIYSELGFSLTFNSGEARSNTGVLVLCDLRHVGGHMKAYQLEGEVDNMGARGNSNKTMIQGLGSTVSYLRRYLTCMIFNVALTNEDDDGNGGHSEGEPGYRRHDGWEGSGSQATADDVAKGRITELEERQAARKAGRTPKGPEPPLEEALQASVDQRKGPKSKDFSMLKSFGTLKDGFTAMGREDIYYTVLGEWGKKHSNEFPDTKEGKRDAAACYAKMGKRYGPLVERWNRIPDELHFNSWDEVPGNLPGDDPIIVNGVMYRWSNTGADWLPVN